MIPGDKTSINNVKVFKQIHDTKWNDCFSSQPLREYDRGKVECSITTSAEDAKQMCPTAGVPDKSKKHTQIKLFGVKSNSGREEVPKMCSVL